jgi:hypothetical protein
VRNGVLPLAGLATALFLYRRAVDRSVDDFWAFALSVGLPILILGGLWLLREGVWQMRDLRALAALSSGERPRAGAWVAVAGIGRALTRPFEDTLSGQPALASAYQVFEEVPSLRRSLRASSHSLRRRYAGWHMVPTAIETGVLRVRLRGFPDLMELQMSPHGASNVGRLAKTATAPPWPIKHAARAGLLAKVRDEFHVDWKLGEAVEEGRIKTKEWVLRPDEPLCVCGRFIDGALLPSRFRPRGLPVYPGSRDEVVERLRGESRWYLRLGIVASAIATGLAGWLLR